MARVKPSALLIGGLYCVALSVCAQVSFNSPNTSGAYSPMFLHSPLSFDQRQFITNNNFLSQDSTIKSVKGAGKVEETHRVASKFEHPATSLGRRYELGEGTERNLSKAVENYRVGAEAGDARSCLAMARIQLRIGATISDGQFEGLLNCVQKTDKRSALLLRSQLLEAFATLGTQPALANELLEQAATMGDPVAQYQIGTRYLSGSNGIQKNLAKANYWLVRASAALVPEAITDLGWMYFNGVGQTKDQRKGIKLFVASANFEEATALANLANIYLAGEAVLKDELAGLAYLKRASDRGNVDAMNRFGWRYSEGNGVEKSDVEAIKWFRRAADADYAVAVCNLGVFYEHGRGVAVNFGQAHTQYERAAALGNPQGLRNLGVMYQYGRGVKKDIRIALDYYARASAAGLPSGDSSIGNVYYSGDDVPKDIAKAEKYFKSAAALRDPSALLSLALMQLDKEVQAYSEPEVWSMLRDAAEQGYGPAQAALGAKLQNANPPDLKQAKEWLEKAVLADNDEGRYRLAFLKLYSNEFRDFAGAATLLDVAGANGHTKGRVLASVLVGWPQLSVDRKRRYEQWLFEEAKAGNADARQMVLIGRNYQLDAVGRLQRMMYLLEGVERGDALAIFMAAIEFSVGDLFMRDVARGNALLAIAEEKQFQPAVLFREVLTTGKMPRPESVEKVLQTIPQTDEKFIERLFLLVFAKGNRINMGDVTTLMGMPEGITPPDLRNCEKYLTRTENPSSSRELRDCVAYR